MDVQRALGGTVVEHRARCRGLSHVLGAVVIDQAEVGVIFLR
jgi:hypothetical protein